MPPCQNPMKSSKLYPYIKPHLVPTTYQVPWRNQVNEAHPFHLGHFINTTEATSFLIAWAAAGLGRTDRRLGVSVGGETGAVSQCNIPHRFLTRQHDKHWISRQSLSVCRGVYRTRSTALFQDSLSENLARASYLESWDTHSAGSQREV